MTKLELMEKWAGFLRNPEGLDKSEFTGLLTEDWSAAELQEIFAAFPDGPEMAQRVGAVREQVSRAGAFVPISSSDEDLMASAQAVLGAKQVLCEIAGDDELSGLLHATRVRFEPEKSQHDLILRGDTPHNWVIECIGDLFRARRTQKSPEVYAIVEAFYGMQSNFDLQWYCSQPLTDLGDHDLTPLFDFWSMGGVLAFAGEETLVRRV